MKKKIFAKIFLFLMVLFFTPVSVFASVVKFAQISDIHYQPYAPADENSFKLKYYTMSILDDAIDQIKNEKGVDFILVTGDAADRPLAADFDYMYKYLNKNLPKKWYYVLGNHDVSATGMKKADQLKLLRDNKVNDFSKGKTYYSFKPKSDIVFIALDGTYDNKVTPQGYLPPEQLQFTEEILKKSKGKAVVIFLHHPITYPAKSSDHNVINDFELKKMLKKYDNPVMVVGGHFHACKVERDGNIVEVASPAIVSYPCAFRYITIDNKKDKTAFIIDYKETRLKDIQELAKKKMKWSHKWAYGGESDRITTIVIDKKAKNK
ncbi:MAG: metallophosphoesterase [Candidatus Gastranaerophilales bacterium]|nr:metallophosphoesterase [Candidatus Gastranaerophilales bacterium]